MRDLLSKKSYISWDKTACLMPNSARRNRAKDWQKANKGRRLDHIWVTEPLYNNVTHAEISKHIRGLEGPSDHAPVSIHISI